MLQLRPRALRRVLAHRDPALRKALRWCYGKSGEALGRRAVVTGIPLDPFRYPLFERAVDASRAVIVHNRTTAEKRNKKAPKPKPNDC